MQRYRIEGRGGLAVSPGLIVGLAPEDANRYPGLLIPTRRAGEYEVTRPFTLKRGLEVGLDPARAPKSVLSEIALGAVESAAREKEAKARQAKDKAARNRPPKKADNSKPSAPPPPSPAAGPPPSGGSAGDPPPPAAGPPADKGERQAQLRDAIEALGAPGDAAESFTQDGRPTIAALEGLLGWTPSAEERDEILAAGGA